MSANNTGLDNRTQSTNITSMNLRYSALRKHKNRWVIEGLVPIDFFNKKVNPSQNNFLERQLKYLIQESVLSSYADSNIVFSIEQLRDKAIVGFLILSKFTSYFCISCLIFRKNKELNYFCEVLCRITRFVFTDSEIKTIVANLINNDLDEKECLKAVGFEFNSKFSLDKRFKNKFEKGVFLLNKKNWKLYKLPVLSVVAIALINDKGRILIAKRPEKKPMAGLWEFPGGKVQENEAPELAIIRELREEVGIDVTESCLAPFSFTSHIYEKFHIIMLLYFCRVWRGTVSKNVHAELKWVDPMKLRDYPMPAANVPLIGMLQDFL